MGKKPKNKKKGNLEEKVIHPKSSTMNSKKSLQQERKRRDVKIQNNNPLLENGQHLKAGRNYINQDKDEVVNSNNKEKIKEKAQKAENKQLSKNGQTQRNQQNQERNVIQQKQQNQQIHYIKPWKNTPIQLSTKVMSSTTVRTPQARKYHENIGVIDSFQTTTTTPSYETIGTTEYTGKPMTVWEEILKSSIVTIYGPIVLILALLILVVSLLIVFRKRMECFICLPFNLAARFFDWLLRKKRGNREEIRSNNAHNSRRNNLIPSSSQVNDYQSLLNNERSQNDFENELNNIFNSTMTDLKKGNDEPKKQESKKVDDDFDAALSDYADSLKPSEKEISKSEKINEELERLRKELKQVKQKMEKINENHKSENSSVAGNFNALDEEEKKFRRELDEQNRIFEEKIRKMREKREEKERIAEEERRQIRFEIQQSIAAFLACIQLRTRFQDEEDKWSRNLENLRKPIVSIKTSYYDFQNEVENADYTDDFSKSCLESEGNIFSNKVVAAQNMLLTAFQNLKDLAEDYEDRIFIKIIMESISKQGKICNEIGEELVNVLRKQSDYQIENLNRLNDAVSELDSHGIPTTSYLKKKSVTARNKDYMNIQDVPFPNWLRHFK